MSSLHELTTQGQASNGFDIGAHMGQCQAWYYRHQFFSRGVYWACQATGEPTELTPHTPQTGSILQGHAVRLPVERQAMEASAGSEGSEERERERTRIHVAPLARSKVAPSLARLKGNGVKELALLLNLMIDGNTF